MDSYSSSRRLTLRCARLALVLVTMTLSSLLLAERAGSETLDLGVRGAQVTLPEGWSGARVANFHRIYDVAATDLAGLDVEARKRVAQVSVHSYQATDHATAVQRLREIVSGSQMAPRFLEIAGWPAVRGRQLALRPQSGTAGDDGAEKVWMLTTAVAVSDVVLRFEAWAPADASSELLDAIDGVAASLTVTAAPDDPSATEREVLDLQVDPSRGLPLLPESSTLQDEVGGSAAAGAAEDAAGAPAAGTTVRVQSGGGRDSENEIAVSGSGQQVVIGTNNGFFFSLDGGGTGGSSTSVGSNDPSVSWGPTGGALGTFYAANISGTTTGIWTSTNGGSSFTGPTAVYTCGQAGDPACGATFPDQEHIVADRFNQTAGGDQVYSTWRHLDGNAGVVCSQNGGATWSTNGFFFPGDLPKIGVGQDGFVYVVYHPDNDDDIRLAKFTSCENNQNPMVRLFDVLVVANPVSVACPTPGIDRCNFRNSLASPTVAVDDTDPSHVYVAYADNTFNTSPAPGGGVWWPGCNNQNLCNENIVVQDSTTGGASWFPGDPNRIVVISSGITARRFMPWVCTAGGAAYVSWFDRRAASPGGTTVSNNSLTDFYFGSAFRSVVGNLTRGPEDQLNEIGSTDAQCEAGAATGTVASWPAVVDASGDSEACSLQPQLGGRCCVAADIAGGRCLTPSAASSGQRCDFNQTVCPAGETCSAARGSPKYGDYNGAACGFGRFYATWPSATSPPSQTPASSDIDTFFSVNLVCCEPEVQVPSSIDFGEVCADASATLDVCNTGAENMQVGSISSSDPAFAVTPPVAGFPVTISPDFCFPFQVTFDAAAGGSQSGTLTVNTNDPVTPALTVPVTGSVATPDINVAIADSGSFGDVCKGEHADLALTLFNQGRCDLTITGLALQPDPDSFELPADLQLPLVLSPDADFTVPVRYSPEECFSGKPEERTLRITSDDPDEATLDIDLSGRSPCPNLIIDPGSLDALHAFPTTVVDTTGTLGCYSEGTAVLRNVGACPSTISSITASAAADFTVTAPTQLPIMLPPGEETLNVTVRFTPDSDANPLAPSEVTGLLSVVSDDPTGPDQADLCGESSAQSGVRILVTDVTTGTPVPVASVDALTLSSHGITQRTNLRFTDHPVSAGAVCGNPVQWHVDQETLQAAGTTGSNPNGSYEAKAKEGNLQITESFGLGQCELREFQLQLRDDNAPMCLLLPKGAACSNAGECCSGKCTGPAGGKTCK